MQLTIANRQMPLNVLQALIKGRVPARTRHILSRAVCANLGRRRGRCGVSGDTALQRASEWAVFVFRDVVLHLQVPVLRLRVGPRA